MLSRVIQSYVNEVERATSHCAGRLWPPRGNAVVSRVIAEGSVAVDVSAAYEARERDLLEGELRYDEAGRRDAMTVTRARLADALVAVAHAGEQLEEIHDPHRARAGAARRDADDASASIARRELQAIAANGAEKLIATAAPAPEDLEQFVDDGRGADVALVDLGLPDAEGVDVIERLHEAAPHLPIVAFTADGSSDRVRAAIRAGASGYLNKGTPAKRIVAALQAAAAGLSALAPDDAAALAEPHDAVTLVQKAVARSLPPGFDTPPEPAAALKSERVPDRSPKDALSTRELELLKYLAEGYTNKEIARAMVLAEDTVKKAVQTLIAKLGATDRTHAVVLALRSGLIQ